MKRYLAPLLLLTFASPGFACTIPVFRYALERWGLSSYEMVVYHKGTLSSEAEASLRKYEDGKLNLKVTLLDVDGKMPKDLQKLYKAQGDTIKLPWAVIRTADADEQTPLVYAGVPDPVQFKTLFDSPVRRKLIERLQTGESATFLFLESGDKEADAKAHEVLATELARLEKALQVPEQSTEGPQLKTTLPLKIAFSILKMDRADAKEAGFLKVLLCTEEDLDKAKGPIVFPVFGRGRALCSIVGKDLNPVQLKNVARFLCGECSCQVKELNPGVDLLLTADWGEFFDRVQQPIQPLLVPRDPPEEKKK